MLSALPRERPRGGPGGTWKGGRMANAARHQQAALNLIETDAILRKAVRRLRRIRAAKAAEYRRTIRAIYGEA